MANIENAIKRYSDILKRKKLEVKLLDTTNLKSPMNARIISKAISEMFEKYNVQYVLILGNDDVVPFWQVDADIVPEPILSDSLYVDHDFPKYNKRIIKLDTFSNYLHLPKVPIGRMPDSRDGSGNMILLQLNKAIELHSSSIDFDLPAMSSGFSTDGWETYSRHVYKLIDPSLKSLFLSPPLGVNKDNGAKIKMTENLLKSRVFLYFNVHGLITGDIWLGEKVNFRIGRRRNRKPILLTPELVSKSEKNKAVLTSACYASYVMNKNYKQNIALSFLMQGCAFFFGPAGMSFGAIAREEKFYENHPSGVIGIDLLCQSVVSRLRDGYTVGEAVRVAKCLFNSAGIVDDINILGFSLFGDPSLKIYIKNIV